MLSGKPPDYSKASLTLHDDQKTISLCRSAKFGGSIIFPNDQTCRKNLSSGEIVFVFPDEFQQKTTQERVKSAKSKQLLYESFIYGRDPKVPNVFFKVVGWKGAKKEINNLPLSEQQPPATAPAAPCNSTGRPQRFEPLGDLSMILSE
eukprot:GHVP01038882.1.p1 GENE.GHVP01038882.1~~GHVP01038882.1.p1  ORF type:complete len:148 (+),score=16.83 GHVP01038882.1:3-446(+)